MANLPILVSSHKCQLTGPKVSLEDNGPHLTLMESVSDSLVRNMHTSSLKRHFIVLWQCSPCSLLHKGADTGPAAGLMPFYGPVLSLVQRPVPRYLLHVLETVLGDTANLLGTARMDVLSWRSCET